LVHRDGVKEGHGWGDVFVELLVVVELSCYHDAFAFVDSEAVDEDVHDFGVEVVAGIGTLDAFGDIGFNDGGAQLAGGVVWENGNAGEQDGIFFQVVDGIDVGGVEVAFVFFEVVFENEFGREETQGGKVDGIGLHDGDAVKAISIGDCAAAAVVYPHLHVRHGLMGTLVHDQARELVDVLELRMPVACSHAGEENAEYADFANHRAKVINSGIKNRDDIAQGESCALPSLFFQREKWWNSSM
jgi:hypothetical protein